MLGKKDLHKAYRKKRGEIAERLEHFRQIGKGDDSALLSELTFCICAANSSAAAAARAQEELKKTGLLHSDKNEEIAKVLLKSKVRFHNNKAKYIVHSRKLLFDEGNFRKLVKNGDLGALREYLVKEAKGIGYKEAGHYLRNIGYGDEFAILDRHILKNLKSLGVLDEQPKTLTGKRYLEIEGKMRKFSEREKIPLSHLDLLFWSEETGRIFK